MKVFVTPTNYRCGGCGMLMWAKGEIVGDVMKVRVKCLSRTCEEHGKEGVIEMGLVEVREEVRA